jgi:hypothetical protein
MGCCSTRNFEKVVYKGYFHYSHKSKILEFLRDVNRDKSFAVKLDFNNSSLYERRARRRAQTDCNEKCIKDSISSTN